MHPFSRRASSRLEPPPKQTVSDWANAHRYLSKESSAQANKYRTATAPYQLEVMDAANDDTVQTLCAMFASQTGKALANTTPIPTPGGWTTMGEIKTGDEVFDRFGNVCRVTFKTETMLNRECFEVELGNGEKITADADHQWIASFQFKIRNKIERKTIRCERVCKTQELTQKATRLPVAGSCILPDADLPIKPYTLGVWLGDGHSHSANFFFHKDDSEIADYVKSDGYQIRIASQKKNTVTANIDGHLSSYCLRGHDKHGKPYCRECNRLKHHERKHRKKLSAQRETFFGKLTRIGVAHNKHIPAEYLRASAHQRFELLAGLLDTDGCCDASGLVEYCSTSRVLAYGFLELAQSLGLKARMKEGVAKLYGRAVSEKFRVTFFSGERPLFKMKRKAANQKKSVREVFTKLHEIVSVNRVESVPVSCIQVSSPSRTYLCGKSFIPTHNTEMLNNIVGYFIDADPAPILVVQPTIEFAESWSKERLTPMLRDCSCFAGKVRDARSRDSGNTLLHKQFIGGNIAIVGANAPAGLAGRPRRVVLLDEVDRFPQSAGEEGDPCSLAIRRTESFYNSVIVLTSTPTLKGVSRIEKEFEQTDKRYWFCPCPKCKEFQTLKWQNLVWPEAKPEEAFLRCEKCSEPIDDSGRVWMIKHGEWRATSDFNGKRGYHLNGMYSPFKHKRGYRNRLHQMAAQFLEAKAGGEETLKAWVNTFLAETWEAAGDKIDSNEISSRREDYATPIPKGVLVITWGADVQGDRIEAEIVGWGEGEENWGIKRGYFIGDPNKSPEVWRQLREFVQQEFDHPLYGKMKAQIGLCDAGYATQAVGAFIKSLRPMLCYPSKGSSNRLRVPVQTPKRTSRSSSLLIDTAEFKTVIYSRLKQTEVGPRYMHFPKEYDDEFFAQLTAEKVTTRYIKGVASQSWEVIRSNRRNEALDIRVYNHAALHVLNVNFEKLKANLEARNQAREYLVKPFEPDANKPEQPQNVKPPAPKFVRPFRSSGGFVGGWRK